MLPLLSFSFLVCVLLYLYHVLAHYQKRLPLEGRNVLILTAHPDDECMFFGPTITTLRSLPKTRIHVLCLSTGNADGLGAIRKKELTRSCQVFGIIASQVKTLDHAQVLDLQDGMDKNWSPALIAGILKEYVTKHKIDTIITFDDYGVSGHPNHGAAYHGAVQFVKSATSKVQLYKLASVSLVRKYVGIADLVAINVKQRLHASKNKEEEVLLVSSPGAYLLTHKAMRQHASQLVWFRWLYVTFSRYMFVNQLVEYTF